MWYIHVTNYSACTFWIYTCIYIHYVHFNWVSRKLVMPVSVSNYIVDVLAYTFICCTDMWHVNKINTTNNNNKLKGYVRRPTVSSEYLWGSDTIYHSLFNGQQLIDVTLTLSDTAWCWCCRCTSEKPLIMVREYSQTFYTMAGIMTQEWSHFLE